MQSDYHRRFHEQARQYLDPSVFHDIHVKARGSTGGAAPRTPKGQEQQPDTETEPPSPDEVEKQPVHKSALDAISGMWSRTLDALTGRQNVNKSGIEDGLSAFYGAGMQRPPLKNTQAKKKKRVTKSALMTLADAVAEYDGLEPDGIVAIQLGAEHGRTLGAIGLGYIAQDKATIAHDLDTGRLPFEDATVNQVYVRKSAVDDGLDLDAMMPELRRVCAPGARIYSDFGLTTVNKSGEWDEDAHPRSDNGQFGSGSGKTKSGQTVHTSPNHPKNAGMVPVSSPGDSAYGADGFKNGGSHNAKKLEASHPDFTKQDHADASSMHHDASINALKRGDHEGFVAHRRLEIGHHFAGITGNSLEPAARLTVRQKDKVNKSGDWDEEKHPRTDGGQFGAGSEKTSSGKDIPRADSKAYKTKKRLSNAAFVKVSQEKHPSFTKQDHADAADHHEKQQAALTHAANNHIATHPHDMEGFGALVSAARDHEHAKYMHLAAQKSEVLKSGASNKRINKSALASWDENAHPRADNGQFGEGSGGASSQKKTPGDLVKEAQAHTAAANGLRASASKASGLNKTALLKQAAAHDKQSIAKIKESRALQKQRKAAGTSASPSEPAKEPKPKRAPAAKKAEKQQPEAKKETHGEETTSAEPTNHAETAKIDAKKLTGDQHESLKTYQSPEFARMNGLARGQSAETDYLNSKEKAAYHAQIAHLDSAINNSKLTEPTTVYRGVKMPPSFTKQLKPGAQFSDGGFQSTSSDHEKADEFAGHKGMVLHINVPSGAHALRVSDHLSSRENTNKSEKEIILPRNTQYRVTKVVRANGIVKEVHVDVVGG